VLHVVLMFWQVANGCMCFLKRWFLVAVFRQFYFMNKTACLCSTVLGYDAVRAWIRLIHRTCSFMVYLEYSFAFFLPCSHLQSRNWKTVVFDTVVKINLNVVGFSRSFLFAQKKNRKIKNQVHVVLNITWLFSLCGLLFFAEIKSKDRKSGILLLYFIFFFLWVVFLTVCASFCFYLFLCFFCCFF
jgi:hypothetical protein